MLDIYTNFWKYGLNIYNLYLKWKYFLSIEVNKLAKALDKVTNEKVDVDDVQPVLNGLGIYFPEEELQEVLSSVSIDSKHLHLLHIKLMSIFTHKSTELSGEESVQV